MLNQSSKARLFTPVQIGLGTLLVLAIVSSGNATEPSGSDPILFGMSTALTGPAADLGRNMKAGVEAAFSEANQAGDLERELRLVALDDGYEPARTAPNMRRLIDEQEVLGVVGNVGTPTAIAAVPIANESKTLFFGAFTGAGVLRRSPPDRYVINFRASYAEETASMVDALIDIAGLRVDEIGFFTQRDGYGDAGFRGGIEALKRHGLEDEHAVAHGRYERNTTAVENGLAEILESQPVPRAVILVGAYAPCAQFISLARKFELDALFLNVSFVGSASLARKLGSAGDGVIVTQVVPHFDSDLPSVLAFKEALASLDPSLKPTFGALEGYTAARILIRALAQQGATEGREQIVDSLEGLGSFDAGIGEQMKLDPSDHQASHGVWPTVIRDGKVVPFAWDELSGLANQQE